jgi:uncharacterized membrane protein YphA (DoxX/SURF4 family)
MRRAVAILARLFLAGLFIVAAVAKLREPWPLFAASIDTMQILPEWGVILVARTLPWAELVLGLVLLSGFFLRYSSLVSTGLIAAFLSILVRSYLRGMTVDCGCFGSGEELGPMTLVRDGALLVVAGWVLYEAFRKPGTKATLVETPLPAIEPEPARD